MDLNDLTYVEGDQPMVLTHPSTGVELVMHGKKVVFFVRSMNSPAIRAYDRKVQNKRLKTAQRTGRVNLTVEEVEEDTIQRLALAITGWENLYQGGNPVDYSPESALGLMRDFPWMRDQVDAFIREDGNFLVNSTKT